MQTSPYRAVGNQVFGQPQQLQARRRLIGVLSALCVVGFFASFVLVSRAGLRSILAPPDLLALRFLVAGVLMLPIFWHHGLLGLTMSQALGLAFTGGLGFAAFAYSGFALAPASHGSSLIHGTLPFTTLLVAWTCFGERSSGRRLAGAVVITSGIVLLGADSLAGLEPMQLKGDVLLLCASVCWSIYGLLARRYRVSAIPATALVAVVSAVCFVPAYFLSGNTGLFAAEPYEVIWQGLFQGIAISVVGLIAYTKAVANLGAGTTALFAAAAPVLTTLLSIPVLGEQPALMTWLGVSCVTVGIVVSAWTARSVDQPKS